MNQTNQMYREVEIISLFDRRHLLVDGRVPRELVPKGFYAYGIRGMDTDPNCPGVLEDFVNVNHAGTIISDVEIIHRDIEGAFIDIQNKINYLTTLDLGTPATIEDIMSRITELYAMVDWYDPTCWVDTSEQ